MSSINVTLPDGRVVPFAEGTPGADIEATLKKMIEDSNTTERWKLGQDLVTSTGRGLGEGVAGVGGLLGGGDLNAVTQAGGNWLADRVLDATGQPSPTDQQRKERDGLWERAKQDPIKLWMDKILFGDDPSRAPPPSFTSGPKTSAELNKQYNPLADYKSTTPWGELAGKGASFAVAPGAAGLARGASMAGRAGNAALSAFRYGYVPGVASELAGRTQPEGSPSKITAEVLGAVIGNVAPSMFRKMVTPFPSVRDTTSVTYLDDATGQWVTHDFGPTMSREDAIAALHRRGISDILPGQVTGNRSLRNFETEIGGDKADKAVLNQDRQFTAATLRTAGVQSDRATEDAVNAGFTDIGTRLDTLAQNNFFVPDRQMSSAVSRIQHDYYDLAGNNPPAVMANYLRELNALQYQPSVRGEVYSALRSRMAKTARETGDPLLGRFLNQLTREVDETMERSIALRNPADAGEFGLARRQYANLLVISKAVAAAGEKAADGLVTPQNLRTALVSQAQGKIGYARGFGDPDLMELSKSGNLILTSPGTSNTAQKATIRGLTYGLPTVALGAGGAAGGHLAGQDMAGAMAGMVAGGTVGPLVGKAMLSGPGRGYLTNQLIPPLNAAGRGVGFLNNVTLPARIPDTAPKVVGR